MKKIKKIGYGALSVLLATGGLSNVAHADEVGEKEPAKEQEIENPTEKETVEQDVKKDEVNDSFELNDLVKEDEILLQRVKDLFIKKYNLKEEEINKINEFKTQEELLQSQEFNDKNVNILEFYKELLEELKKDLIATPELAEKEEYENFKKLVDLENIQINVSNIEKYTKLYDEITPILENEKDLYTEASFKALEEAAIETSNVVNKEWSTQDEIDAATMKLEEAKNGLVKKEVEKTPEESDKKPEKDTKEVDKSELINLINKSKELIKNNKDKYTDESIKKVENFLVEAQKVVDNEDATQEDVDKAIEELKKQGLVEIIKGENQTEVKTVNKDKLIKAVKAEKDALDQFTDESKKDMVKALEDAQKVIDNENATQEDIDKAMAEIDKAKEKLVKKIDANQSEDGKGIMPQTGQDWINLLVGVGILGGGSFGLYKSRKKDDNEIN